MVTLRDQIYKREVEVKKSRLDREQWILAKQMIAAIMNLNGPFCDGGPVEGPNAAWLEPIAKQIASEVTVMALEDVIPVLQRSLEIASGEQSNKVSKDSERTGTPYYQERDKIDGWAVCEIVSDEAPYKGKWFAFRERPDTWCEIRQTYRAEAGYLHADGEVRYSTSNDGQHTGYFDSKEAVEAAIKKAATRLSKNSERSEIPEDRLAHTLFIVEATKFEQQCLWEEHAEDSPYKRLKSRRWEDLNPGYMVQIGELDSCPIYVCMSWARIDGQMIMFWETTSQIVDTTQVELWLSKHFTGKWDKGTRPAETDAMNFHHCLDAIDEANKALAAK